MAYRTASINDANPGPLLYAALADALTNTAGCSLVDTVAISTRTHKVWKFAAASNAQNLDWYLDVAYSTTGTAGGFFMQPFEGYDPATDLGLRGIYVANSTVIDAATGSRYGATGQALETNWIGNVATYTGFLAGLSTAMGYWLSVTPERCIVLTSQDPTFVFYAGLYLPDSSYAAKAGAALYPLVAARLANGALTSPTTSTCRGGLTRLPPLTSLTNVGWASSFQAPAFPAEYFYPVLPTSPTTAYPLTALTEPIFTGGVTAVAPARFGEFRDLAVIPSAAVRGDTATIAGEQWVLASPSNGISTMFKAA